MTVKTMALDPKDLLNAVDERNPEATDSVCAYWLTVDEHRTQLIRQIREESKGRAVVPMAIRESGLFLNANVVMQDLVRLVTQHREEILEPEKLAAIRKERAVVFLLVSREPLSIPQTASPVHFPDWFPLVGGLETAVRIVDLSWSVNVPINSRELEIDTIRALLFDMDYALFKRLKVMLDCSRNRTAAFFARFFQEGDVDQAAWLGKCESLLTKIEDPMGYRPTLKNDYSMISRLWRIWATTPPESLGKFAEALRKAMSLSDPEPVRRGVAYLITRPPSPVTDREREIFIVMINVVAAGCQLSNAAAHSSEYDKVNRLALRGISVEIQESLRSYCDLLD